MNLYIRLIILPIAAACCVAALLAMPAASQAKYKTPTVLYYGDSLAAESATYVRSALAVNNKAVMVDRTYPGTSPCDWTPAMKLDLSRGVPAAVILETFGNNISRCQIHGGSRASSGSSAYWRQYKKDITDLISMLPDSVPVWLTAAPASWNNGSGESSRSARMFALMQEIAASRNNTWAVDAGAAVEDSKGGYVASMPCLPSEPCTNSPSQGRNRTHAYDGLHFCPAIHNATIALLRHCPVYASGAWRFGMAQVKPVINLLGF